MNDFVAEHPMRRVCPFEPPPEMAGLRRNDPVARVRIWDGSTPWLITRYEDQRATLTDLPGSAPT